MALPTDAMDALMTITALTCDDLAEIADLLTRLFSAEGQGLALNQQEGAAQGEGATLRGVLESERERTSELCKRGDHGYRAATATPLGLFAKLRRAFGE
jgi:hypothetical protein